MKMSNIKNFLSEILDTLIKVREMQARAHIEGRRIWY